MAWTGNFGSIRRMRREAAAIFGRQPMRILLLFSALLTLLAAPTSAEPFFDTLADLGDVYDDTDIFSLVGDHSDFGGGVGSDWFQGTQFTSQATGTLTSIDVAIGHLDVPETMQFLLYEDAGGALGTLLETIPVDTTTGNWDGAIRRGFASSTTELTAGTSYWLMATSTDPTIWFQNELTPSVVLPRLWTPDGVNGSLNSDTTDTAAFRLNGPAPVPLSRRATLIGVGLSMLAAIGLMRVRLQRRLPSPL